MNAILRGTGGAGSRRWGHGVAVLAIACSTATFAQIVSAPAAQLSHTEGSVAYSPKGDNEWHDIQPRRALKRGDRLWTDRGSRAEVMAGPHALRIDGQTQLVLENVSETATQLSLTQGSVVVTVPRMNPGESFELGTPNLAFRARATGDYRIDVDSKQGTTRVAVLSGQGIVYGERGESLELRNGQRYTFRERGLEKLQQGAFVATDDFDRWSGARRRGEPTVSMPAVAAAPAPKPTAPVSTGRTIVIPGPATDAPLAGPLAKAAAKAPAAPVAAAAAITPAAAAPAAAVAAKAMTPAAPPAAAAVKVAAPAVAVIPPAAGAAAQAVGQAHAQREQQERERAALAAQRAEQAREAQLAKAAEQRRAAAAAAKRAEEERRVAAARKAQEDKRIAQAQAARAQEQKRLQAKRAEEERRVTSAKRAAEEKRLAQAKREEQQRVAQARRAESQKIAEARRQQLARLQAQAEQTARDTQARRAQDAKRDEDIRREEQARRDEWRREEQARRDEDARREAWERRQRALVEQARRDQEVWIRQQPQQVNQPMPVRPPPMGVPIRRVS